MSIAELDRCPKHVDDEITTLVDQTFELEDRIYGECVLRRRAEKQSVRSPSRGGVGRGVRRIGARGLADCRRRQSL
jgi:hypothetical protein